MNLATASGSADSALSFPQFASRTVQEKGFGSLYAGLGAGLVRQLVYATSRLGLFDVFRDELSKYYPTDIYSRLLTGVVSGGCAALISCPAEVTLVRISNDCSLPLQQRRNYSGVVNAFSRILREEGFKTFFSGCGPFVNRAMLVGAVQVGTYDQFRESYRKWGVVNHALNVFYSSMTSGLIYSAVTMPFETAKNRMAFQKPDALTGRKPYRSAVQTIATVARNEGVGRLWAGFPPYYLRCGGHTVIMFMTVEWIKKVYLQGGA